MVGESAGCKVDQEGAEEASDVAEDACEGEKPAKPAKRKPGLIIEDAKEVLLHAA